MDSQAIPTSQSRATLRLGGNQKTDDPSTNPQKVIKPNKSTIERVPRLCSLCRVHYALAFLLKDERLDVNEYCPKNGDPDTLRTLLGLTLRDHRWIVWPKAKLGLVWTRDKKFHGALILARNTSVSTRKALSKEQVEEMKRRMKVTWDPHWYWCDLISKNLLGDVKLAILRLREPTGKKDWITRTTPTFCELYLGYRSESSILRMYLTNMKDCATGQDGM
ncbi:hypothetical protein L218DRAFT_949942 [Marasmius fiardii PR-910]|nr:hypothetical protein L218DRAFT_949942 [Marasmius fiardii PR-910]